MLRALPLLFLAGCATLGTMQTAETAGEGNVEVGIEPGAAFAITPEGSAFYGDMANLSLRYGVSDKVDIGGRIGTAGLEILTKFMLTDTAGDSLMMSLAPSIGGFAIGAGGAAIGVVNLTVPLIIGIPVGVHQLVITPKAINILVFGGGGGEAAVIDLLLGGASFGFSLKVGPFRILPEVSVMYPLVAGAADSSGNSAVGTLGSGLLMRVGVGLIFGGRKD